MQCEMFRWKVWPILVGGRAIALSVAACASSPARSVRDRIWQKLQANETSLAGEPGAPAVQLATFGVQSANRWLHYLQTAARHSSSLLEKLPTASSRAVCKLALGLPIGALL